MKAFIFVALVASVAARSLDLETLRLVNKDKTLLNTPVINKVDEDLLLKEQQLHKNVILGKENLIDSVLPVEHKTVGGIYNYDNVVDTTDRVLSIEELYNTELFREYLALPLFRQYIQYPSFQRFIGSVYFQRFWQLPAYKQYFVNPVLFYKYVYPIVQLFNTEYSLPSVYGHHEDVLGLKTLVDDVLLKNKNFLPYAYNYNRYTVPTTAFQGETTNYKFLLDKLYKTLYANQVPVTHVKTDVKLIPEKVVVEPITHQQVVVEEPKIVDVQVDQKIESIVPVTTTDSVVLTERDVLLLKELLEQHIIAPEVYQAVIYGKIHYATVLRQVIARGVVSQELYGQIISRLQTIDTVVPVTTDSAVLTERHFVILKDLLHKSIITPEIYQAVVVGKIDFVTIIRQVLERRGLTTELINLFINRLVDIDSVVPVLSEKDVLLVKELLRQRVISSEVYQTVLYGKVDFFTLLRQVLYRRDVIDTIYPVVDSVVLTERNIVLLKQLLQHQYISQETYEAVIYGKIDFVTILRQVLERRGLSYELINLIVKRLVVVDSEITTQQDVLLLKELLREGIISSEIYQAIIYGKIDFYTVLRQIIFRRDVVDTVVPYTNRFDRFDRFSGNKYDFFNKYYGYKNLYNTEIPSFQRENVYNRFPIVA